VGSSGIPDKNEKHVKIIKKPKEVPGTKHGIFG
jgi:hypothetical protein